METPSNRKKSLEGLSVGLFVATVVGICGYIGGP